MSKPTTKSMARMKRLARYLLEYPETVITFSAVDGDQNNSMIHAYSDSDWAGCPRTRRSTTGGILTVDGGVLKTWSSMQTTVAQSSGEAEYYAMVRAAAEALGLQSIMRDMGWSAGIQLWVDSSAADGPHWLGQDPPHGGQVPLVTGGGQEPEDRGEEDPRNFEPGGRLDETQIASRGRRSTGRPGSAHPTATTTTTTFATTASSHHGVPI